MPARSLKMIRRDINRLKDTIQRHKESHAALAAFEGPVSSATQKVNEAWQNYQKVAVAGDKEREERNTAIGNLLGWIQRWRPVVLLLVPGANENLRKLPSSAPTPDDVIRVAEDMVRFIQEHTGSGLDAEAALADLGDSIEETRKETRDAVAALPAESEAREAFTEACLEANPILVRGTQVVRAIFGRTSPEYKLFIARSGNSGDGDEDEGEDADTGE
ncbi:hypothetical protein HQ585_18040 [candidate division KSB1 bacterium]|nr:hypothetical protein [candidate division KSB1 bacterium]